jgi:hypothetical protein
MFKQRKNHYCHHYHQNQRTTTTFEMELLIIHYYPYNIYTLIIHVISVRLFD